MATTTKFVFEDRFAKVAITFSYIMLLLGGLFGFLQVLSRAPGMAFLYVLFGGDPLGYVFVAPAVGLTLYTSALALVKKSDDAFWKMFKASSPALALFLIALVLH